LKLHTLKQITHTRHERVLMKPTIQIMFVNHTSTWHILMTVILLPWQLHVKQPNIVKAWVWNHFLITHFILN